MLRGTGLTKNGHKGKDIKKFFEIGRDVKNEGGGEGGGVIKRKNGKFLKGKKLIYEKENEKIIYKENKQYQHFSNFEKIILH